MKNKTNITTGKSKKINAKTNAATDRNQSDSIMYSGLDRNIVLHSVLLVSLLVNAFFLAGYMVIGSNADYAYRVATAIYNF